MKRIALAAVAALAFQALPLFAGILTESRLEPISHAAASLTVVGPDGVEHVYTPAELEEFPTYSLNTTTPWREVPANFEGVLLSDVLAAHGLSDADDLLVTAENDYQTTIPHALFSSVDILIATRVDGQPHSRRMRGPIQFVIDAEVYAASPLTSESNLVWMAARIESAD